MSYARPTLISQIVQKERKGSINPRNEDEAAGARCLCPEGRATEAPFPVQRERRRGGGKWEKRCREESWRSQVAQNASPGYLVENTYFSICEFSRIEWRDLTRWNVNNEREIWMRLRDARLGGNICFIIDEIFKWIYLFAWISSRIYPFVCGMMVWRAKNIRIEKDYIWALWNIRERFKNSALL